MRSRPTVLPLVALIVPVLLLAGCASSSSGGASTSAASTGAASSAPAASASATATPCPAAGSASAAVKASFTTGKTPTVSFPTPTTVTTTQRSVLKAGSGAEVKDGTSLQIAYALYDGRTGKQLDEAGFATTGKGPVVLTADRTQYLPGLVESLVCTQQGERIASAIPPSEAFGSQGQEQLGIAGGDTLVLVAEVLSITPTKATGTPKALPSGFPKVTLAADGQPTVTIPKATAPTTLEIAESESGSGDVVKSGDTVTVQYQGVLWRTGAVFDQSWGKTGPTSFATTAVVKGFGDALVGHRVGSQVVAIVPPAYGYGKNGSSDGSIKGTDTMVFVIDILATAHASANG